MPSSGSFLVFGRCADDARVDYDSLLDSDQRRSRFSEELLDVELRESVRLGKMYRQLQRQINCRWVWVEHRPMCLCKCSFEFHCHVVCLLETETCRSKSLAMTFSGDR